MDGVLERGDIQFCFQPTVQPADADEYALGVQSFFAILSPAGGALHRRMRIGKKRMPSAKQRFWARIERVGSLQRALGDKLEAATYETKTRGNRYQPAARPVATGSYAFVQHGDHVHLEYDVEPVRFEMGFEEPADAVAVDSPASHLVLFDADGAGRATWTHRGSVAQLDEEGAELVLVGSCARSGAGS